jgi:hypothetical protein
LYYVSSVAVAVVLFFFLFNFLFFRKFQEPDLVSHRLNSKLEDNTIDSFSKQSSMDYISNVS